MNPSTSDIARSLGALSTQWLDRRYSYRQKAVRRLVRQSGYSEPMAEAALDSIFRELTAAKLTQLLRSEIGDPACLDGFRRNPITGVHQRAHGPQLITHILSSNVPNPAIFSLVFGILLRSRSCLKVSSREKGLVDIYLESLKKHDRRLAVGITLIRAVKSLQKWITRSDLVVAYGTDETIREIQKKIGPKTRFIGYGHRTSFSFYTKEALTRKNLKSLLKKTALDLWSLRGMGCLTPSVIYIERGGEVSPSIFSEKLTRVLAGLPQGRRHWYEKQLSQIGRMEQPKAQVIGFSDEKSVFKSLAQKSAFLQAVSLETAASKRHRYAEIFSCLGLSRVTFAGKMQSPPVAWHHDGMPNLSGWLRWTDLE